MPDIINVIQGELVEVGLKMDVTMDKIMDSDGVGAYD